MGTSLILNNNNKNLEVSKRIVNVLKFKSSNIRVAFSKDKEKEVNHIISLFCQVTTSQLWHADFCNKISEFYIPPFFPDVIFSIMTI